jgi:hypothetical protein
VAVGHIVKRRLRPVGPDPRIHMGAVPHS